MRRMSFSATVPQMRAQTKTVTRRAVTTWAGLKPGDQLTAIEKGMGLRKGESQVPIGVIEVVSNTIDSWANLSALEVELEGFPGRSPRWFVEEVWVPMHGRSSLGDMRRIEFRHVDSDLVSYTVCDWCEGVGDVEDHNDYTNRLRCSFCKGTGSRGKRKEA